MRTFLELTLQSDQDSLENVFTWLKKAEFMPFPDSSEGSIAKCLESKKECLLETELPSLDANTTLEVPIQHAFNIFTAIPLVENERQQAWNTARWVIRSDYQHGNQAWGLVCIDGHSVVIRWRHRITRSLESATARLVSSACGLISEGKLFRQFKQEQIVVVREPLSTSDAYIGEILSPGPLLVERARNDKKTEIWITTTMLIGTAVFFVLGFYFFRIKPDPNSIDRWISGFFDRLATTALLTAAISYLSYYLHLRDLRKKTIIDWK